MKNTSVRKEDKHGQKMFNSKSSHKKQPQRYGSLNVHASEFIPQKQYTEEDVEDDFEDENEIEIEEVLESIQSNTVDDGLHRWLIEQEQRNEELNDVSQLLDTDLKYEVQDFSHEDLWFPAHRNCTKCGGYINRCSLCIKK